MEKRVHFIENFLNENEFDGLLERINLYNTDCSYPGWKYIGHSSLESFNKKFWYIDLKNDPYFTDNIFSKIKSTIKYHFNENIKLDLTENSVYLNGATFGQQGYYHTDGCDRTFLIYCNPNWNTEHSGATVFTVENDKKEENHLTIYPKKFSAVYFDSSIKHFSQSLSADFSGLRITLAYKLFLDQWIKKN